MTSDDQLEKLFGGTTSIIGRVSRLDSYVHSVPSEIAGEIDAVSYLRATLAPTAYIPPAGGWAAQYRTMAFMVAEILEAGVGGEVVELGGGVSTIWMGLALRARGEGHLTSVDHDETYAERTSALVRRHGLQDHVDVVHASLVQNDREGEPVPWYDTSSFVPSLPPIGLLFVDGPPATDDPLARRPALAMLRHRLRENALVVLDDVDRPGEQEILEQWISSASPDGSRAIVDTIGRSAAIRCSWSSPDMQPSPSL